MKILAALDRAVHATRLDIFTPYCGRKSRNLRWLPLLVIAGVPLGYAMQVGAVRTGWSWQMALAGSTIFFLAFTAAILMRYFGPRLGADPFHPLDERERDLRARAGNLSGLILASLTAGFCFYGGFAAVFGTWLPTSAVEWVFLGLGIEAYAFILPVLVASWLQAPVEDVEEEA